MDPNSPSQIPKQGQSKAAIDDTWFVAKGRWDDKPILMRVRKNLQHLVGHARYPHRLTVAWEYEPTHPGGFPSTPELDEMEPFENRLSEAFERDDHAVAIAVVTHNGSREWIFYSSDLGESERRLNVEFEGEEPYPIRLSAGPDPEWKEYLGILENSGATGERTQ